MSQISEPKYSLSALEASVRDPLSRAYKAFGGDPDSSIPWLIWLLENPDSPVSLGGAVDLRRHDYLHILFNRGTTLEDEAFIIGMTMGNDARTNWFHYGVFKIASRYLYPKKYRFEKEHFFYQDSSQCSNHSR